MNTLNRDNRKKLIAATLLICLPVIAVVVIFNFILLGPIQKRIVTEHSDLIKNRIASVDTQVSQIEKFAVNLSVSLNESQPLSELSLVKDITEINRVANQLFLLKNSSSLVKDARIIVLAQEPYAIKIDGTTTFNLDNYQKFSLKEKSPLLTRTYVHLDDETYLLQEISSTESSEAVLIVKINTADLLAELSDSLGEQFLFVQMDQGQTIAEEPMRKGMRQGVLALNRHFSAGQLKVHGKKYHVIKETKVRLDRTWDYYSITSVGNLFKPMVDISAVIILLGVLAIISTFVATQFYRKVYRKPIKQLIADISSGENISEPEEIDYLRNKWKEMTNRQQLLTNTERNKDKKLREKFIFDLVEGRYFFYSLEELSKLGTRFQITINEDHKWRFVKITLTGGAVEITPKEVAENDFQSFVLENIALDLGRLYFKDTLEIWRLKGELILLCKAPHEEALRKFSKELGKNINPLLKKCVIVTVGEELQNWIDLAQSYQEVSKYSSCYAVLEKNQILSVGSLRAQHQGEGYLVATDVLIEGIMEDFKLGQKSLILSKIKQLAHSLVGEKNKYYQLEFAIRHLYAVLGTFLQAKELPRSILPDENLLKDWLLSCLTADSLENFLLEQFIEPAWQALQAVAKESLSVRISELITEIQEHYSDPSISLEQFSDRYGLDSYALSKEFKNRVGMNYIDYLTDIRIKRAQELLRHSDLKINDIAMKVGYQPSYFNRIFKRKVGSTPGEYRQAK